ncbi:hypothetical protein SS1G_13405 [Sclerotinia sclerotiorum 1980 UF-70]|uniref:Uncharacterized protein n=1 Tax=Sclerotinia sclerotiorum (strain ATCC 18683 / 1980 / Ss-1) TaxID=665079 RepID=A7F725_SCLS1|nr:hypothetical protein SS1G_13405 [Sclerotinia sclerotiorum 1980 UF-70]EDN98546.1 hypothetical protein SS1G_13405 [Sclerotinia sclerotiorum 1980 UF-70]
MARHQSSSPTPIFETVLALAKGTERLTYENTFLNAENCTLRKANEALSKRRRMKKTQLRQGGVLTGQEAADILSQQKVDIQIQRDERQNGGNSNRESSTSRCCSMKVYIIKMDFLCIELGAQDQSSSRVQTRSDFIELVCDLGHLKIVCARTIRNRVIRSLEEPESF